MSDTTLSAGPGEGWCSASAISGPHIREAPDNAGDMRASLALLKDWICMIINKSIDRYYYQYYIIIMYYIIIDSKLRSEIYNQSNKNSHYIDICIYT